MTLQRALFSFLLSLCAATAFAQARRPPLPTDPFIAVVEGRSLRGLATVQIENTPCLSLRDVLRLTGGRVEWRQLSREFSIDRQGREASFTLDVATAVVEGKEVPLEIPVRWWTGQAYVPLTLLLSPPFQSFAEAVISWEPGQRILAVNSLPDISSPRFTAQRDRVRVSFELSPRVEYRVMAQAEGELTLRFFGGRAGARERLEVKNDLITAVDLLPRAHSTDVMFYFGDGAGRPLVTMDSAPRRLVVEVRREGSGAAASDGDGSLVPVDAEPPTLLPFMPVAVPVPPADVPAKKSSRKKQKEGETGAVPVHGSPDPLSPVRVIVLDAGHGGQDVGAVGRRGTLEKDVNLAVTLALADALRATGRYEVHLTRTGDEFMSLQDRAEYANKLNANLFISVHSNAGLNAKSSGFEIYFLSEKASDDGAAAVARRENASMELEGPAEKVQARVAQLLWSLAKTQDLNESSEIAALVDKHAGKNLGVENRGVKQAGFYVLKWAKMPAVLVESAFITNPQEEKLLRSRRYQGKIVQAVVSGIREYERRKIQTRLGKNTGEGS